MLNLRSALITNGYPSSVTTSSSETRPMSAAAVIAGTGLPETETWYRTSMFSTPFDGVLAMSCMYTFTGFSVTCESLFVRLLIPKWRSCCLKMISHRWQCVHCEIGKKIIHGCLCLGSLSRSFIIQTQIVHKKTLVRVQFLHLWYKINCKKIIVRSSAKANILAKNGKNL